MAKNREEIKKEIKEFFKDISNKSPEQVRKIKQKAMSINYKLGSLKRSFCQKCYHVYSSKDKIRIKEGIKTIVCGNCGKKRRWKI